MPTENLLSVVDLKKYFPLPKTSLFSLKKRYLKAAEEVSFDIKKGEIFGLVGESGCGKSTLGRTLLQLYRPTSGQVLYYGREQPVDLTKITEKQMRTLRKDLQIIFQDPYSSLNPRMTVSQIIGEGAVTHGFFKRNSEELKAYVLDVMKKCGLQAHMATRYPHEFSGGQRQRICIARALALKPKFIVCDENWKPKEKVHLSNDDKVGFDEDMYLMEEAVLEDFIEDNAQRIAYIYDTDGRRKFLLELVEQIFGENTEHTYIRRRKGTPPTQFLKNTDIDNIMPSIGATSADEIDTEESTTEDSFSEDELDLEGFEVSEQ